MWNVYIDPPSGWRYGFPKKIMCLAFDYIPNIDWKYIERFLLDNGYPSDLIDLAKRHTRFYTMKEE